MAIKIKTVKKIQTELADFGAAGGGDKEVPDWWGTKSDSQQEDYIKEHPTSTMKDKLHKHVEQVKDAAKKIGDSAKNIRESQKEFFDRGEDKPGSKERRGFGQFVKDKAKGLVKAAKHEVKEWKDAGVAIGKLATGKKISHHEKDALKTVAIHAAMTIIPMALTGGLSVGLSHAAPAIATHFLEHSLVMTAGKVAMFASSDSDSDSDSDSKDEDKTDELMEHMLTKFGDYIADADIDWKAVFASDGAIKKEQSSFQVKTIPATKVSALESETRALPVQTAEALIQRVIAWANKQNTKDGKDIAKYLLAKMTATVTLLVDKAVKRYEEDRGWAARVKEPKLTSAAVTSLIHAELIKEVERIFPHSLRGYKSRCCD